MAAHCNETTIKEYTINMQSHLGEGTFGCVYKATHTGRPGEACAAKKIHGARYRAGAKELLNCEKLQSLGQGHENVLEIYDVVWPNDTDGITDMYIFTEYCEYGDLNAFVKNDLYKLSPLQSGHFRIKCDFMCQISSGLSYLHENNIVHRDIKPGNILIRKIHDTMPLVKIGDYGLSRFLEVEDSSTMQTNVGTNAFKSPQHWIRTDEGEICYNRKTDIFSTGVTFRALLMSRENKKLVVTLDGPSCQKSEKGTPIGQLLYERMKFNQTVPCLLPAEMHDDDYTRRLKSTIQQMLEYDEQKRVTAQDAHIQLRELTEDLTLQFSRECDEQPEIDLQSKIARLQDQVEEQNKQLNDQRLELQGKNQLLEKVINERDVEIKRREERERELEEVKGKLRKYERRKTKIKIVVLLVVVLLLGAVFSAGLLLSAKDRNPTVNQAKPLHQLESQKGSQFKGNTYASQIQETLGKCIEKCTDFGCTLDQYEMRKAIDDQGVLLFDFTAFCSFVAFLLTFMLFLSETLFLIRNFLGFGDAIEERDVSTYEMLESFSIRCGSLVGILLLSTLHWRLFLFQLFITGLIYCTLETAHEVYTEGKVADKCLRSTLMALSALRWICLLIMEVFLWYNWYIKEGLYNFILIGLSLPVICSYIHEELEDKRGSAKYDLIITFFICAEIVFTHGFSIALYFLSYNDTIIDCIGVLVLLQFIGCFIKGKGRRAMLLVKIGAYILLYLYGTSSVVQTGTVRGFCLLILLVTITLSLVLSIGSKDISDRLQVIIINFVCHLITFPYLWSFQPSVSVFIGILMFIVRILCESAQYFKNEATLHQGEIKEKSLLPIAFDAALMIFLSYRLVQEITLLASLYLLTHLVVTITVLFSLTSIIVILLELEGVDRFILPAIVKMLHSD